MRRLGIVIVITYLLSALESTETECDTYNITIKPDTCDFFNNLYEARVRVDDNDANTVYYSCQFKWNICTQATWYGTWIRMSFDEEMNPSPRVLAHVELMSTSTSPPKLVGFWNDSSAGKQYVLSHNSSAKIWQDPVTDNVYISSKVSSNQLGLICQLTGCLNLDMDENHSAFSREKIETQTAVAIAKPADEKSEFASQSLVKPTSSRRTNIPSPTSTGLQMLEPTTKRTSVSMKPEITVSSAQNPISSAAPLRHAAQAYVTVVLGVIAAIFLWTLTDFRYAIGDPRPYRQTTDRKMCQLSS
ncbi:m14 [Muromegalovirus G4]|uniref:M14 n=1 Tax=Muromegalovirus G4 TaxID=524650 RepID=B3UWW6_MUHV1|nr:m14 [Muromegalovirus G4]QNL29158.1 m14 [Muromegalovirus G4]